MRIWTNNATAEVLLCEHGRHGPSGFVPQVVRNHRLQPMANARFALPVHLSGSMRSWSFTVRRSHDSTGAAQDYLMRLHAMVPLQADVWAEVDDGSMRYLLPECCIRYSVLGMAGVQTRIRWSLSYSEKQKVNNE